MNAIRGAVTRAAPRAAVQFRASTAIADQQQDSARTALDPLATTAATSSGSVSPAPVPSADPREDLPSFVTTSKKKRKPEATKAFALFIQREKAVTPGVAFTSLSERWKALPDDEKKLLKKEAKKNAKDKIVRNPVVNGFTLFVHKMAPQGLSMKAIAEQWKDLPEDEMKLFIDEADKKAPKKAPVLCPNTFGVFVKKNRVSPQEAVDKWKEMPDAEKDLYKEEAAENRRMNNASKPKEMRLLTNVYSVFLHRTGLTNLTVLEMADQWKALPDAEKKLYEEEAKNNALKCGHNNSSCTNPYSLFLHKMAGQRLSFTELRQRWKDLPEDEKQLVTEEAKQNAANSPAKVKKLLTSAFALFVQKMAPQQLSLKEIAEQWQVLPDDEKKLLVEEAMKNTAEKAAKKPRATKAPKPKRYTYTTYTQEHFPAAYAAALEKTNDEAEATQLATKTVAAQYLAL